jgi:hypothetical protein
MGVPKRSSSTGRPIYKVCGGVNTPVLDCGCGAAPCDTCDAITKVQVRFTGVQAVDGSADGSTHAFANLNGVWFDVDDDYSACYWVGAADGASYASTGCPDGADGGVTLSVSRTFNPGTGLYDIGVFAQTTNGSADVFIGSVSIPAPPASGTTYTTGTSVLTQAGYNTLGDCGLQVGKNGTAEVRFYC